MSGPGTDAFVQFWDLRRRADFQTEPPCVVTDDLDPAIVLYSTFYRGRDAGHARYQIKSGYIPGQSAVEHEMGHDIQKDVADRTGKVDEWITDLFAVRGAPIPTTPDRLTHDAHTLMIEQACSMLPEAFLGQWGGYRHPLYDNINDPAGAMQESQAFFQSPRADSVRQFYRNYRNWAPTTVVVPDTSVSPAHTVEWLGGVPRTNYNPGRMGNPITLVVDHWTAAPFDSAVRRFQSNGTIVSAHYIISQTGRIVQMVSEDDTAYHSGVYEKNLLSIGIEHEASPTVLPSDALYAASTWLHQRIATAHNIRLEEGVTVLRHKQIVPTECPGTLDIARILKGVDVTPEEAKAIAVQAIADAGLDPNTVAIIKRKLDEHTHPATKPVTA